MNTSIPDLEYQTSKNQINPNGPPASDMPSTATPKQTPSNALPFQNVSSLRMFYFQVDQISRWHRTPKALVLIHSLAVASAMARGSVSSTIGGMATLPLLILSQDLRIPDWMSNEWIVMQKNDDLNYKPSVLAHPMQIKAKRRRDRIKSILDPESMFEHPILARLYERRMRFSRVAFTYGTRNIAKPADSLPLTHLSASLPLVRAVLRRMTPNSQEENMIGCVTPREFNQLVRSNGTSFIQQAGLVLPAPPSVPNHHNEHAAMPITGLLFEAILRRCYDKPPYVYAPDLSTETPILNHMRERKTLIAALPEVIRPLMPKTERVIYMAALLACISDPKEPDTIPAAGYMAIQLDSWAFYNHLRIIRMSYPADDRGYFEGDDLAVFRQLSTKPQTLRDIQRRLRKTSKATCMNALQRAMAAGLVIEEQGLTYQLTITPSYDLSEKPGQITGFYY